MTPAEVRHAEQLIRSAGWRQRINSAARRAARGAAIGGVVVTATTIVIRLGLDYHAGRITDEQYFARLAGVVARDAAVAAAVAAVFSMVGIGYPVLAPVIAPIAAFLVMEVTLHFNARMFGTAVPPILGWPTVEPRLEAVGGAPEVHLTATSRSLYAPPIADPDELNVYVAEVLGRT